MLIYHYFSIEGLNSIGGVYVFLISYLGPAWYFSSVARKDVLRYGKVHDLEEDVQIELTLIWPAVLIGHLSAASVYYLNANPVGTLTLNAGLSAFLWYVVKERQADGFLRDIEYDNNDACEAIQRRPDQDNVQKATRIAFITAATIGTSLAHVSFSFSVTDNLNSDFQILIGYVWRVIILPLLVFGAMVVVGKHETVWTMEKIIRRKMRQRKPKTEE